MATAGAAHDAVLSELEQGPFSSALRLKIEARGEGDVTVRMPFGEGILNAGGPGVPIHGGAIAALADFAACAAVWTLPETRSSATISMTVNYTAPAVKTDLVARARVRRARQTDRQHRGRNPRPARRADRRRAGHLQNCLTPTSILAAVRAAAARHGLNLCAALPLARYDAAVQPEARASLIDPAARSIVVLGNGGGDFWAAFKRHAARNPGWWERENPLDDFTREVVEREVAAPLREAALRYTIVHPFMHGGARTLNFVELGKAAGIAGPSILGVVVHPMFGPWIAFRAALLLDVAARRAGRRARLRSVSRMRPAQLPQRVSGRRGEFSRRMGRAEMPDASGRGRAGLRRAMPRASGMRARPGASLSRRRARVSSDARAARDAPVLRNAHQAQA